MKNHKKSLTIVRFFFPEVQKVTDSEKSALVEVTPSDASHGDVKNHKTCALAIACKRFFHADGVIIGLTTSYIIKGKIATRFLNPDSISREITSFDRKAGFDIGFYNLCAVSPGRRLGVHRSGKSGEHGSNNKRTKGYRHYTSGVRTTLGQFPDFKGVAQSFK